MYDRTWTSDELERLGAAQRHPSSASTTGTITMVLGHDTEEAYTNLRAEEVERILLGTEAVVSTFDVFDVKFDRPPPPPGHFPTIPRRHRLEGARNGFQQMARLPCYRGSRCR